MVSPSQKCRTLCSSRHFRGYHIILLIFRLAYFERKNTFYNKQQLQGEIVSHYTKQFLRQLYVLVFGLEILGNPYGLVVDVVGGVQDFFYQPFQVTSFDSLLPKCCVFRALFKARKSLPKDLLLVLPRSFHTVLEALPVRRLGSPELSAKV